MSAIGIGAGVFLIIMGLIVWVTAMPTLATSLETGTGKALENLSTTNKTIVGSYAVMISMIPVFMFALGLVLAWKG